MGSTTGKTIAILGTGANGSSAGVDLIQAGYDVALIDQWPAHVEAMRADGLTIELTDETVVERDLKAFHLCDVATFRKPFDIVLLMSKAYDARWLGELIKPYLAEDGLLIAAQNAMTAEDMARIVGGGRTIGCVVELSSELFTPGVVKRNTPKERTWFGVGALDASMAPRVAEVAEILGNVGKVSVSDDIISAKWMKLIVNAMTMAIRSVTGLTSGEIAKLEGVRELMLRAGEEALVVGHAVGYRTVPIMGLTEEDARNSNRFVERLLDKLIADVGPSNKNAMYQGRAERSAHRSRPSERFRRGGGPTEGP